MSIESRREMAATLTEVERRAADAVDLLGVISNMLAGGKLGKALDAGGQGQLKVRLMAAILDVVAPPLPGAGSAYDLVTEAIADGRREATRHKLRAVAPMT
jgi:hypothetical protein